MSGDPDEMYPTPVELDHEQHVQPGQPDRLDSEEIAGQHATGLRAQERTPPRS
jgi:hypothetical protein